MLQAISSGKTKFYRRYLGRREEGEHRVCEEDELTALLLGPLAFLPAGLSAAFWLALLEDKKAPNLPEGEARTAAIHFWPSRSDGKGGRIEPDMQVDLVWASGEKLTLLIELKWRAALSGENQLHRQWQDYLTSEERKNALHLFIAPETSEATKALNNDQGDVWQGRLLAISWFDILSLLQKMKQWADENSKLLLPWTSEVSLALNKLGIRPFRGFGMIEGISVGLPAEDHLFWRGFSGFGHLSAKLSDFSFHNDLFFNQRLEG